MDCFFQKKKKKDEKGLRLFQAIEQEIDVGQILAEKPSVEILDWADEFGRTCLHICAATNQSETLDKLLIAGASKEKAALDGTTPLYIACQYGHLEALAVLLRHGADPSNTSVSPFGWSPLHICAANGRAEAAEMLIRSGADVCAADSGELGQTALHVAASNGHGTLCSILCSAGAAIDATDKFGATPIHEACRGGHRDTVETLLCLGADPNHEVTSNGDTALSLSVWASTNSISRLHIGGTRNDQACSWHCNLAKAHRRKENGFKKPHNTYAIGS